jgi:hypothetical protein
LFFVSKKSLRIHFFTNLPMRRRRQNHPRRR